MFKTLKKRGYQIAIATGRSKMEMEIPFQTYGWLDEFDEHYVATYSDVEEAEAMLHMSLDKPNPFAYYLGPSARTRNVISTTSAIPMTSRRAFTTSSATPWPMSGVPGPWGLP